MVETMRFQTKLRMTAVSLDLLARLMNRDAISIKRKAFSNLKEKYGRSNDFEMKLSQKLGLRILANLVRLKRFQKTNQAFKDLVSYNLRRILAQQRSNQAPVKKSKKKQPVRAQRTSSKIVITSNTRQALHDKFNSYVTSARSKSSQPSDLKTQPKTQPFTRKLSSRKELATASHAKPRNMRNSYSTHTKPVIKYSKSTKLINNPHTNKYSRSDSNFFQPGFQPVNNKDTGKFSAPPEPSETYSVDLREKLGQIHFENRKKLGAMVPKLRLSSIETPR